MRKSCAPLRVKSHPDTIRNWNDCERVKISGSNDHILFRDIRTSIGLNRRQSGNSRIGFRNSNPIRPRAAASLEANAGRCTSTFATKRRPPLTHPTPIQHGINRNHIIDHCNMREHLSVICSPEEPTGAATLGNDSTTHSDLNYT